jgi:hypothetical protein
MTATTTKTKPKTTPTTRPEPKTDPEPLVFPPEKICPDQTSRF